VKNTFGPTANKYGLKVSLDGNSRWVVDKTSYLTSLTVAQGATISAPKGFSVTLTVDGGRTPMKASTYTGRIELRVAPGAQSGGEYPIYCPRFVTIVRVTPCDHRVA